MVSEPFDSPAPPRFASASWLAWLLAAFTTLCSSLAMPMVLHDMPGPTGAGLGGLYVALGMLATSGLLRFVALPRAIARGELRAGSLRALVQLSFCWLLALLSLGAGVGAARAIGDIEPLFAIAALASLLVVLEVPARQPSRR